MHPSTICSAVYIAEKQIFESCSSGCVAHMKDSISSSNIDLGKTIPLCTGTVELMESCDPECSKFAEGN